MTAYLESLKTTVNQPDHACKLVSKVEQTETKLEGVYTNRHRLRGIALATKINNESVLLQVDTGASGIVVNRNFAEKAGLSRISAANWSLSRLARSRRTFVVSATTARKAGTEP